MSRPVTLFTGQWADIPLDELLPRVAEMGYDGLELACWGDHFDVRRALTEDDYCENLWARLEANGLACYAISNHLVGQCICDNIDERHQAILPEHVWGDGEQEGVRERAAEEMKDTARAARKFFDTRKDYQETFTPGTGKTVVNGFTGSSVWHTLYAFPPTSQEFIQRGFDDFGRRFKDILQVFDELDVYFALEVHPSEIAFDLVTTARALEAVDHHPRFGFNFDPSHFGYQGVNYIQFIHEFGDRIHHVHMKDNWWGRGDGSVGVFGGHTEFCDHRRHWDFRSVGRGDIDFEEVIAALNDIAYDGPLSVEWEDGRMDRFHGAEESCAYVRSVDFPRNATTAFDAAFDRSNQ